MQPLCTCKVVKMYLQIFSHCHLKDGRQDDENPDSVRDACRAHSSCYLAAAALDGQSTCMCDTWQQQLHAHMHAYKRTYECQNVFIHPSVRPSARPSIAQGSTYTHTVIDTCRNFLISKDDSGVVVKSGGRQATAFGCCKLRTMLL